MLRQLRQTDCIYCDCWYAGSYCIVTNRMPKMCVIDPIWSFHITFDYIQCLNTITVTAKTTHTISPYLSILTICGTKNTQEKQTQAVCRAHPCPNKCALNKTVKTSPSSTFLLQTRNVNANTFNFDFLYGSLFSIYFLSLAWRSNRLYFLS